MLVSIGQREGWFLVVSDKLSQQIKMTHKLPLLEQLEHFREQLDQTHENFDLTGEVSFSPLSAPDFRHFFILSYIDD